MRLPAIPSSTRAQLRHLAVRLDGVSRPALGRSLPEWKPTRLNTRLHTALGLAELVLRGNAYELDDGRVVRADGLIVQMWKIFEDFVTTALAEALRRYGGRVRQQDPGITWMWGEPSDSGPTSSMTGGTKTATRRQRGHRR